MNLHDAVGNDILAMDETLKQQGYDSRIMAYNIHEALKDKAEQIDFSVLNPEDLAIFHKATGDRLTKKIAGLSCKKVMVYHNITPARYYPFYDPALFLVLTLGRWQLRRYAPRMDACWAVSRYNAEELQRYGVREDKTDVLPILFSREEKHIRPDTRTEQELREKKGARLLAIGRIAPNKKLEDAIKAYAVYKDRYDPDATLYFLGSWDGQDKYYAKLKGFAADLNLTDDQVVFAGKVSDEEREAYLRNTDVLLCLSEHEGFCVPVLEAAGRDLPVIAYSAAAVPETLGDSGLLFPEKNYEAIAEAIARLRTDESFRNEIIRGQRENLKRFDRDKIEQKFLYLVSRFTGKPAEPTAQETEQYIITSPPGSFLKNQRPKKTSRRFKPLWRIHNKTYRQYAKGTTVKRLKTTASKILKMIR